MNQSHRKNLISINTILTFFRWRLSHGELKAGEQSHGICRVLDMNYKFCGNMNTDQIMNAAFKSWPQFSGSIVWPVEGDNDFAFGKDAWANPKRLDLLNHVIEQTKLNEMNMHERLHMVRVMYDIGWDIGKFRHNGICHAYALTGGDTVDLYEKFDSMGMDMVFPIGTALEYAEQSKDGTTWADHRRVSLLMRLLNETVSSEEDRVSNRGESYRMLHLTQALAYDNFIAGRTEENLQARMGHMPAK